MDTAVTLTLILKLTLILRLNNNKGSGYKDKKGHSHEQRFRADTNGHEPDRDIEGDRDTIEGTDMGYRSWALARTENGMDTGIDTDMRTDMKTSTDMAKDNFVN